MKQVIQNNQGQIKVHLGSGNGELTAPAEVTVEQVKQIVEDFPPGTQNRKKKILDAFAAITQN